MTVTAKETDAAATGERILIEPDLAERLALLSERTGKKKATLVRKALEQMLDDEEDLILARAAIEHNKTFPQRYTLDEVKRELGLDD